MIGLLAVLAAAIAEALAFYCGAEVMANGYNEETTGQYAPSAVTFALVAIVGWSLPRLGTELALPRRTYTGAVMAIGLLLLYSVFRIEFAGDLALWDWTWVADFLTNAEDAARDGAPAVFGGAFLIAAFARGTWRGGDEIELEYLPRSLSVPLVVVLLFIVFASGSDRAAIIGRGAAAFFAFTVVAMALSQAALSGATFGNLRTGSVTGLLLAWTGAATVAGLLVFGVILGLVGEQIGSVLYTVINAALYIVLTPIAWVLVWFFDLIIPDVVLDSQELEDLTAPILGEEDEVVGEDEGSTPAWRRVLRVVFRAGILGVVALVVVGVLILVARLRRRGALRRTGDVTVATSGSLGADLLAGIQSLFSRHEHERRPQPAGIYSLYSHVLDDADRRGLHRAAGQTPEEFAPSLHDVYHSGLTDEITAAFELARYGGREPDPRLVSDLQTRWERSRQLQTEG